MKSDVTTRTYWKQVLWALLAMVVLGSLLAFLSKVFGWSEMIADCLRNFTLVLVLSVFLWNSPGKPEKKEKPWYQKGHGKAAFVFGVLGVGLIILEFLDTQLFEIASYFLGFSAGSFYHLIRNRNSIEPVPSSN